MSDARNPGRDEVEFQQVIPEMIKGFDNTLLAIQTTVVTQQVA